MTDKILKEAFDKMVSIEEGRMEDEEGIDVLEDVQQKLFAVIEELDSAIRAYVPRSHSYWQSYGLAQLKIIAGSDEYAAGDKSINNLIQDLRDDLSGGDEDEGESDFDHDDNDWRPKSTRSR